MSRLNTDPVIDDVEPEPAPLPVVDDVEPEPEPEAAVEPEPEKAKYDIAPATNIPALMQVLPADFPLPTLIRFVPSLEKKKTLDEALAYALQIVVEGPDGIQRADRASGALADAIKDVEAHFEEPIGIANQLHKSLTTQRAEWVKWAKEGKATVGRRIWTETNRLELAAAEVRRQQQEAANRQAREAAEKEAAAAAKQGAPAAVVEQLQAEAKTAQAPPVAAAAAPVMRATSTFTTWKVRIKGTPADAEPLPTMDRLSPAQRAHILALLTAIIKGEAPLGCIVLNESYLNSRAKADKSALNIAGLESFQDGGVRAKGTRSR